MEIEYSASRHVREVIASIGRTEDVRFSPCKRRLAIAAFERNQIAVFDLETAASAAGKVVTLRHVLEFSSPCLSHPHGLDFIEEDILVVANRRGGIPVFKLPPIAVGDHACELSPIQMLRSDDLPALKGPGSVSAIRKDRHIHEILLCENFGHCVVRHLVDGRKDFAVISSDILLNKWLNVPDGVCVSHDRRWIAVSNHRAHNVLLYENSSALNQQSDPAGILRCVDYPHGLRFSSDDRHIFVADAGAPYVHIYAMHGQGWQGVRNPIASFRVMNESVYLRGRCHPEEGGPKGIDIDENTNIMAVTSKFQPLAFFDVTAILARAVVQNEAIHSDQQALEFKYEMDLMERVNQMQTRAEQAETRAGEADAVASQAAALADAAVARASQAETLVATAMNSWSWRITAPLRRLHAALSKRS